MIDVLIVTYNSAKTLDKCLKCIKREIPYNRILVGDGGSRDDTVKIARSHGAEVYMFTGRNNMIGRIRYRLAEIAETDWLLYVDSDVYLLLGWWKYMSKYMAPKVGMAMAAGQIEGILKRYHLWRIRRYGFVTFGNTLVPRDLLLSFRKMEDMHVGEDTAYAKYCRTKNYLVIPVTRSLTYHDKKEGLASAYRRWGKDMRYRASLPKFVVKSAVHLKNTFMFAIEENATPRELAELLKLYFEMYRGYLKG
ncbi:MAG TPA: glycosyltransferase family 2 protein [Candidatus Bathyarchaeota archaeon]|nr:glycosyltransferase family 2 protein [Candidatus Bathyarchaeota archaeon]